MAILNALDYSWARPDPRQMAAAGIKVVARYLWSGGKGVTVAEIAALHAAGIGVVLNYEASPGNHLLGAAQGRVDGAAARQLAASIGVPAGWPIYFSCDREVTSQMMPTVLAYLHAADSAAHPSRCYAQFSVCEAYGRPAWQTVAWSYGQISARAALYQYAIEQDFNGSAVDHNEVRDATALGAWWPAGHTPAQPTRPFTPTPTLTLEDEMFLARGSNGGYWLLFPNNTRRPVEGGTETVRIYLAGGVKELKDPVDGSPLSMDEINAFTAI